jgi:hypothetical protein
MITPRFRHRAAACSAALGIIIGAGMAGPVAAQDQSKPQDYLGELKACRAITDDAARLACYDAKISGIVVATDAGEVRIVDREDVRKTRRQLFGFSVPNLGILSGNDNDDEKDALFVTTIASARSLPGNGWRFTTAEGAVWEISNPHRKIAPIKPGDNVEFKKASLGFYFIRIAGQIGVKGRRVQ